MGYTVAINKDFLENPMTQKLSRLHGDKAVMAYIRMLCIADVDKFEDEYTLVIDLFDPDAGVWSTDYRSISTAIGVSKKLVKNVLDFLQQEKVIYVDHNKYWFVGLINRRDKAVTEDG